MHEKEQKDLMSAVSARSVNRATGVGKVRALQRVLYRCAKQDQDRRFHALYDKVALQRRALESLGRGPCEPWGARFARREGSRDLVAARWICNLRGGPPTPRR
jgi:hypothetical protein